MNADLIILNDYCLNNKVDPDFIFKLELEGIIQIYIVDDVKYIHVTQLGYLDQYVRWHYDLAINIEGIDVIRNLLVKMEEMQLEIKTLREKLQLLD